jgi:hypothetical protein
MSNGIRRRIGGIERASVMPLVVQTVPKKPKRSRKPALSDDEGVAVDEDELGLMGAK